MKNSPAIRAQGWWFWLTCLIYAMSCLGYLLCQAEPTWTRWCYQSNNSIICQWGKTNYHLSFLHLKAVGPQYVRTILISMNIDHFSHFPFVHETVIITASVQVLSLWIKTLEEWVFLFQSARAYLEAKFWTCCIPSGCWVCELRLFGHYIQSGFKTWGRQACRATHRPSVDKICWHMGTQNLIDRGCELSQWLTVQPESQHRQERLKIG